MAIRTKILKKGVRYDVFDSSTRGPKTWKLLWSKFVPFGRDKAHRAGGQAFVEAAQEQERRDIEQAVKGVS